MQGFYLLNDQELMFSLFRVIELTVDIKFIKRFYTWSN
jgi:hypothetical protein